MVHGQMVFMVSLLHVPSVLKERGLVFLVSQMIITMKLSYLVLDLGKVWFFWRFTLEFLGLT
jgi:hypothetical protein